MGGSDEQAVGPRWRRRRWQTALLGSTALVGIAVASPAVADQTWIGTTSGDWFTGTNWSGNAAPTGIDNVTIDTTTPNAATINSGTTGNAQDITVGNNATGSLSLTNGSGLYLGGFTYLGRNTG